jgi:hypothetical protein
MELGRFLKKWYTYPYGCCGWYGIGHNRQHSRYKLPKSGFMGNRKTVNAMKKIKILVLALFLFTVLFTTPATARGGGGQSGSGGRGGGGNVGGFSGGHGSGFSGSNRGFSGGGPSQQRSSGVGVRPLTNGGGGYRSGFSGVSRGGYVAGHYYGGHYYSGGHYGGHSRYYYRGYAPYGAAFGFFLGGVVVGGLYTPFWWPYYYVPVSPAYYDPYYRFPYSAPSCVIEVPPTEATTAYSQEPLPATMPPNQCYVPQTDQDGSMIMENGNPVPDFSKPVPCPPRQ